MNVLHRRVGEVRRRLFWSATLRVWPSLTAVAIGLAVVGLALDTRGWIALDRMQVLAWGAVAALVAAPLFGWWKLPDRATAALELERRCALDERVSTVLALERCGAVEPGAAAAVRDDAEQRVAAVDVRRAFPIRPPRRAFRSLIPAALIVPAVYLLVPPARTIEPAAGAVEPTTADIRAEVASLERKLEDARAEAEKLLLVETERLLEESRRAAARLRAASTDAKEALVALNDLAKRLEERRKSSEATVELQKQLSRLRSKQSGPADKFAEALSRGQFQAAAERLRRLREELQSGKLDEAQRRALGEQLDQLQQQLDRLAAAQQEQRRDLERREAERKAGGQQAGAADDGDAPQPRDGDEPDQADLAERAAQAAAQQVQLEHMAQALADAAAGAARGDGAEAQQALERLQQQLEQLGREAAEGELLDQGLDDVARCKAGLRGDAKAGATRPGADDGDGPAGPDRQAAGGGGQKPGDGPGAGDAATPHDDRAKSFDSLSRGPAGRGALRAAGPADGPNSKGRVLQTIERQAAEAAAGESTTLEQPSLDVSRRRQKRQYFDALRRAD